MTQVRRGGAVGERARTSQRLWFLGLRRLSMSFSIWSGAAFFFARGDAAAAAAPSSASLRCTAPKERSRGAAARCLRFWLITGTGTSAYSFGARHTREKSGGDDGW